MKRFLSLFCTTLALLGCSATGPTFQATHAPSTDEALIYIYRPASSALSARSSSIQINDTPVAVLSNNGYTTVYVKPGRHKISQHYPALLGIFGGGKTERPMEIFIDTLAGEQQYIEVLPRSTTTRDGTVTTIHFVWTLAERSKEEAFPLLKSCKFQAPLRQ